MTVSKHDLRHGRQGGRIVDFNRPQLTSGTCDVCGALMLVGQRQRHYVCDAETIVAKKCTCAPGCTVDLVGDGPEPCDPSCEPCRLKRNVKHKEVPEWRC